MTLIPDLIAMTERFARDIIGLPIPDRPTRLSPERKKWASGALSEELTEFMDAETLEDEVDALLDLMYFAGGRIVEMGVLPGASFEEVHAANMKKERGELSKRPHSKGFDAIKPEGWTAPDLKPYCTLTRGDVQTLGFLADLTADNPLPEAPTPLAYDKPKVLVLGYARHGKDTVSEMLRDLYGFQFTSSSQFCAETVVWKLLENPAAALHFLDWVDPEMWGFMENELEVMGDKYDDPDDCFRDRGEHRALWYQAISWFNSPDKTALGRAIFETNDVYCGLRHKTEFHAVRNAGIPDLVVWVDRSDHLPPEDKSSCSVEPWMADFVVDNNGSLADLERNVQDLFGRLLEDWR
ncbi:hydrolase [Roseobacter phage RDJL6]|nr:hydrolase [Roseobacter phage RDJL6]